MYFNDWLMHRTLTASKKDISGFEGDMKAFEKVAMKYGEQYRGFQSRSISDEPSMEEGPESIPKPRCIPSFPWPWRSLLAPWSFIENRWARNPWSLKMIALVCWSHR